MNFEKFKSIFAEKSKLFFKTVTLFDDLHEGNPTLTDKVTQESMVEYKKGISPEYDGYFEKNEADFQKKLKSSYVGAHCWCMSAYEPENMMRDRLKNKQGVAIQSTFKRLTESFYDEVENVYVGMISYSDITSNLFGHFISPLMHKRALPKFEEENEIRALISSVPIDLFETMGLNLNWAVLKCEFSNGDKKSGSLIQVNLEKLLERIYIYDFPNSGEAFLKQVTSVATAFSKNIIKSGLTIQKKF